MEAERHLPAWHRGSTARAEYRIEQRVAKYPEHAARADAPRPDSLLKRLSLRAHLKPRHKLWLNWNGAFLMGPRYLRFLDAVERTGTIRAAGEVVGWSYRTCLNRIRAMEHALGAKVLTTTRGGRRGGSARLTPVARQLTRLFARWRRRALHSSEAAFRNALTR